MAGVLAREFRCPVGLTPMSTRPRWPSIGGGGVEGRQESGVPDGRYRHRGWILADADRYVVAPACMAKPVFSGLWAGHGPASAS